MIDLGVLLSTGEELVAIDKVIKEAKIGYGNAGLPDVDFWDSELFSALTLRRDTLRQQLKDMG